MNSSTVKDFNMPAVGVARLAVLLALLASVEGCKGKSSEGETAKPSPSSSAQPSTPAQTASVAQNDVLPQLLGKWSKGDACDDKKSYHACEHRLDVTPDAVVAYHKMTAIISYDGTKEEAHDRTCSFEIASVVTSGGRSALKDKAGQQIKLSVIQNGNQLSISGFDLSSCKEVDGIYSQAPGSPEKTAEPIARNRAGAGSNAGANACVAQCGADTSKCQHACGKEDAACLTQCSATSVKCLEACPDE